MPNERRYSNELNLESVGINLPYNMQAEQSVLGAVLLKPETLTDLGGDHPAGNVLHPAERADLDRDAAPVHRRPDHRLCDPAGRWLSRTACSPVPTKPKVYLTGLAETVPSISNVKAYAQIVQEKVSGAPADGGGKGHPAGCRR